MIEEKRQANINVMQNIVLENREKLNVTGINDILSFDDQVVILSTDLGMLTIKGNELKINKLNIDERLSKHDDTLVNDIANIEINGKNKYFYSFASKYCSHHNSRYFPIYDRYV